MKRILSFCTVFLLLATGCSKTQSLDTSAPDTGTAPGTDTAVSNGAADTPKEDIVITMASFSSLTEDMEEIVQEFNNMDNGYQIVVKEYEEYIEPGSIDAENGIVNEAGLDPAAMQLQMDILQGGIVDIVPDTAFGFNMGRYEVLLEKGAFIDLYPFMAEDPEINTQTLDAHILNLHEMDGELRCLPAFYTVTTLLGNPEYVGTKQNWTFEEMQEHWNNAPDGLTFNHANATKNYVYYTVLRDELGAFIDYENVSCSFDSPLFVKMLEFCDSFPETPEYKTDAESVDDFVYERAIRGYQQVHEEIESTLVGYPSEDGCGVYINASDRYSICRTSSPEVQQGAWEFIRMFAEEDYQYENLKFGNEEYYEEWAFPVNTAASTRYAEELIAKHESGTDNPYTVQGVEYDEGWMSREEYDAWTSYVSGISKLESDLNHSLQEIVEEEIWRMFDGMQTAEETASAIQGRASIMVSEQS